MFTGIVEERGRIVGVQRDPADSGSARLTVRGPKVTSDVGHGDSIAVSGVCLTVVDRYGDDFTVDVMAETLRRSTVGGLSTGDRVNLERALPAAGRLDGHLVQGHVDGVGRIRSRRVAERWTDVTIELPTDLARYVAVKGSIAVDGISLTITGVGDDWFSVSLIPTTLAVTTLGHKAEGDRVNLETDVLAKYVERLLGGPAATGAR